MTQPVYKLKDDHAASIRHVRELYTKVVSEFATLQNTYSQAIVDEQLSLMLKKDGTRQVTNTLQYSAEPLLANRTDIPHLGYALDALDLKADKLTTYTKTETDTALDFKADQATTYTKTETDTLLTGKKNTGTFDTKIQNSTGQTSLSCDTDRYISVKSMGTKLCDILEDEQNQGMTILTNNKRFNVVSSQPQTLYHNSPAALFNFKYTDDGNQVAGQARFGQIQLAPSNTTNLNPALTFTSSRVNGLGTAGAIFLDSSYGSASNPLIISPQSLTDAGGNQFSMLRSTATLPAGTLRNTFTGVTGSTAVVSAAQQFATKTYVDSAVSGLVIPDPDLTPYLPKSGGTMTGDLFLNAEPTQDLQASTKKYVDDRVDSITGGGFVGDLLSEAAADPINIYLDNGTIRLRKNVQDFMAFGEMSALGNPFLRTVNRFEWEQQALISNSLTPEKQSRVFSVLGDDLVPTSSYPQFLMDHHRNGDLRLSTFNYLGAKTQLFLHPGNLTKTNHIEADRLIGYREDFSIQDQNDYSILPRGLCDSRYALKSEIPTVDTSQLVLNAVRLQLEDSIPSQPQVILRTGAEEFIKFKRSSSNTAQMITHPFLAIQSNNIAPNYEVQIKQGLQALSLKVNGLEQTAEISNSNSAIKFNDYQTNQITFTGRPGLEPSAFNVQTNNNSFLTKSEAVALLGSGGGNGGGGGSEVTSLISADRSSATISDRGILTINDQATANQIIIRADSQSIAPFTFGNSSLLLLSKSTGVVADGGSLQLFGTTQSTGLCNVFTRATGYNVDNLAMVSGRQFTHKAYVDGLSSNYLSSGTTLTQINPPLSSLSLNGQKIINLGDPTGSQDAATKGWTLTQIATGGTIPLTFGTQVLLGNVPFTTGSSNTVNQLEYNSTNFPTNPSSIIQGVEWVRQSGRNDTIRIKVKLDPAIVSGRNFTVYCQPQTKFVNTSGGPASDWQFGDSLNRYVLQTFNIDVANSRFYVHICDISATSSENLLLNMLIAF